MLWPQPMPPELCCGDWLGPVFFFCPGFCFCSEDWPLISKVCAQVEPASDTKHSKARPNRFSLTGPPLVTVSAQWEHQARSPNLLVYVEPRKERQCHSGISSSVLLMNQDANGALEDFRVRTNQVSDSAKE